MQTEDTTFSFKNAELKAIPLSQIRENTDALRTEVDKQSEKYIQLVDSVRTHGIINPISVRPIKDPATGETLYGLVDGLHRYNAAMDCGFGTINAQVGDIKEGDLREAQIIANLHKIETQPMQYTNTIIHMMGTNPLLTKNELCARLNCGIKWLEDRLGLKNLKESIQKLVDNQTLGLSNAYALSKLPQDRQEEFLQQALSKPALEFTAIATAAKKDHDKAVREGRKAEGFKFVPTPRLRRMVQLKDEADFAEKAPAQSTVISAAMAQGCTSVQDTVAFVLKWMLHLDPATIAADEKKYNDEKEQSKQAAEKRKLEREAKKQQAAEAAAAAATVKA